MCILRMTITTLINLHHFISNNMISIAVIPNYKVESMRRCLRGKVAAITIWMSYQ